MSLSGVLVYNHWHEAFDESITMLTLLALRHLAIVEHLEVEFAPGFGVITGETGAGKSILLHALALCLGGRADAGQVRQGCERAEVSALFDVSRLPDAQAWLKEHALDEQAEAHLRRVIGSDGRSRAFINGSQVSLADLRQLGSLLMEVHGQHEHQSLLRKETHRQILDRYAGAADLAAETDKSWCNWQEQLQEIRQAQEQQRQRREQYNIWQSQSDELEKLDLKVGELHAIEVEYDVLAHVDARREHMSVAWNLLDDDGGALLRQLRQLRQRLSLLQHTGKEWDALAESAELGLQEVEQGLRQALDHLEANPDRLAWLDDRLAQIHRLARRFGCDAEALPAWYAQLQGQMQKLQDAQNFDAMQAQADAAAEQYAELSAQLTRERIRAAQSFEAEVAAYFPGLGLTHARLEFRLIPMDTPDRRGCEDVEVFFSANPGQDLRPLARIASGGELSRISLALQVVYATSSQVPTLVFDEVDVGVSGQVAEAVGRLLRALGERTQILCITHQPQVAARGHHHWRVEKQVDGDHTRTLVSRLDEAQRVEELARLSGGSQITSATIEHARALLESGE
ncbi:MAG: DNA repair protein RecN [Pseudomonadales bacterium]|nr:DNA repair protein RecN [Pseudomonadales bacterium]